MISYQTLLTSGGPLTTPATASVSTPSPPEPPTPHSLQGLRQSAISTLTTLGEQVFSDEQSARALYLPCLSRWLDGVFSRGVPCWEDFGRVVEVWAGVQLVQDDGGWRWQIQSGKRGVYSTPADLARRVVEATLGPLLWGAGGNPLTTEEVLSLRILDLSVGGGVFLVESFSMIMAHLEGRGEEVEALRARVVRECLWGLDIHPGMVEITRHLLACLGGIDAGEVKVFCADALDDRGEGPGAWPAEMCQIVFDGVVGNPPFSNAIETRSRLDTHRAQELRRRFPLIFQGASDLSTLFVAMGVEHLRPGGRYGWLLPRVMLAHLGARSLRLWLEQTTRVESLHDPDCASLFPGTSVYVVVVVGCRLTPAPHHQVEVSWSSGQHRRHISTPLGGTQTWWEMVFRANSNMSRRPVQSVSLGSVAHYAAGCTVSQAYLLAPRVTDDPGGSGMKLLTTGLIDRCGQSWGQRPARFLGRSLLHPRWPEEPGPTLARTLHRQTQPKVMVGGLSRRLEAVADVRGEFGGVVSTHLFFPAFTALDVRVLALWLSSWVASITYLQLFGAKRMGNGNWTFGRKELQSLPIPAALLDAEVVAEILRWLGDDGRPLPTSLEWERETRLAELGGVTDMAALELLYRGR